jgi:hypothetical protein
VASLKRPLINLTAISMLENAAGGCIFPPGMFSPPLLFDGVVEEREKTGPPHNE